MDEVDEDQESPEVTQVTKIKTFKRRWLILFIFTFATFGNGCLYTSLAAMSKTMSMYYDKNSSTIDWLDNCFMLISIFTSIPSAYFMECYGLRLSVILMTSLNTLCGCLHLAGLNSHGFVFIMLGQIFAALAFSFVMQIPAALSAQWFSNDERSKATSIGFFANLIGVAIGFVQPTNMVKDSSSKYTVKRELLKFYVSQLIFLVVTLLLVYMSFEDKPPCPPSYSVSIRRGSSVCNTATFWKYVKMLVGDVSFNLHMHAVGIYYGMYVFIQTTLNEFLHSNLKQVDIGWIGSLFTFTGIVGILLCSFITDQWKCYKLVSILLLLGTLCCWIMLVIFRKEMVSFGVWMVFFGIFGLFSIAMVPNGIEQGIEITYPVPEGTSSAFIVITGNLYGFILVLFLGAWINNGKIMLSCCISLLAYLASFLFVCITKTRLKREEAEEQNKNFVCGIGINTEINDVLG